MIVVFVFIHGSVSLSKNLASSAAAKSDYLEHGSWMFAIRWQCLSYLDVVAISVKNLGEKYTELGIKHYILIQSRTIKSKLNVAFYTTFQWQICTAGSISRRTVIVISCLLKPIKAKTVPRNATYDLGISLDECGSKCAIIPSLCRNVPSTKPGSNRITTNKEPGRKVSSGLV